MEVWPGTAYPLGATFDGTGTNFALFSERAERVELCLLSDALTETRIELTEVDGYSLAAIATARSMLPVDLVVSLIHRADAAMVSFNMSDDDIVRIMRQPWTMTCSDGELTRPGQGKPHPRGYGAVARKLAVYVRDRHVIDLPEAVRSMTSLPAAVFGLRDRGVIVAQ